ncbi:MAG: DUF7341 domain-containing protein, partial [Solirubrobacteraceae bacterium]
TKHHATYVLSLIDQLDNLLKPGGIGDGGVSIPSSRPPGQLEAIDTLLMIDVECSQWIGLLGLHERPSIAGNLRALVGVSSEIDDDQLHKLSKSAVRWYTSAAVLTGWERPTWKPANTCPVCAQRGGLRVRLGDGENDTRAVCVECQSTWGPDEIGLLAQHIRWENREDMDESA